MILFHRQFPHETHNPFIKPDMHPDQSDLPRSVFLSAKDPRGNLAVSQHPHMPRSARVDDMRHSACDVSFPLRVGFDEHPLIAAIRSCCRGD
jgi:hypothetical protein